MGFGFLSNEALDPVQSPDANAHRDAYDANLPQCRNSADLVGK